MRIVVFQHVAVEHPGVLRDFWDAAGHRWDAVELDAGAGIPPLDDYELMVVMGGPMDVWQVEEHPWLIPEKQAIAQWVRQMQRPFLGICLGHQLLADALGGRVTPMTEPEVGVTPVHLTPAGLADPLLAGFPPDIETLQWHGVQVAGLPEGAVILAGNAHCPVQAMRWGAHAWGLQYHVELTPTTVADWEAIPAYKASLVQALGESEAARLGERVAERLPQFRASARRLNHNLMAIVSALSQRR